MYILIGEDNSLTDDNGKVNKGSSMDRILEFVNHHNYWYDHFDQEQIKKMEEDDTVPGEELDITNIVKRS